MTNTVQEATPGAAPSGRDFLFSIALGGVTSQMLAVAASLGIADLLIDGPKSAEQLASATGTDAASLQRVMRGLASLGVFSEDDSGQFGSTAMSAAMCSDLPNSFRMVPIYLGGELYRAFGGLLQAVRSGERAFDQTFESTYFQYLGDHPDAARVFNEAMTALGAAAENNAVAAAYNFPASGLVVDVGGGQGALLAAILAANPSLQGILFDRPGVEQSARAQLEAADVAHRATLAGGDFFSGVPEGGDIYVLKRIIHDWDDAQSVAILKNCRTALAPAGRVLIVEDLLPPGDAPSIGKLVDVVMMSLVPGRERTTTEYRQLLERAGLSLNRVMPTASAKSIIEAVPSATV